MDKFKYTPFPATNDLAYPFFISEAKPGVRNPGFESIDAQTALPIRSCLMPQQRLREASSVELNPLVWYMPYQGDVCKLAACVMHEDEVVSPRQPFRVRNVTDNPSESIIFGWAALKIQTELYSFSTLLTTSSSGQDIPSEIRFWPVWLVVGRQCRGKHLQIGRKVHQRQVRSRP